MSLPREISLRDGKLIQRPLPALESLREGEIAPDGHLPPACEMRIDAAPGDFELALFTRSDGSGGLRLSYDSAARRCSVDRSGMDHRFNTHLGEQLAFPLERGLRELQIYIDKNSTEIFLNGGEETFTTHSYPTEREFHYQISPGSGLRIWTLRRSVTDEFRV